jgi:hypothetical protein
MRAKFRPNITLWRQPTLPIGYIRSKRKIKMGLISKKPCKTSRPKRNMKEYQMSQSTS